jgi:hypothetical protein
VSWSKSFRVHQVNSRHRRDTHSMRCLTLVLEKSYELHVIVDDVILLSIKAIPRYANTPWQPEVTVVSIKGIKLVNPMNSSHVVTRERSDRNTPWPNDLVFLDTFGKKAEGNTHPSDSFFSIWEYRECIQDADMTTTPSFSISLIWNKRATKTPSVS